MELAFLHFSKSISITKDSNASKTNQLNLSLKRVNSSGNMWAIPIVLQKAYAPCHEISNNGVCLTSKAVGQPAHTDSLISAFASRLNDL